MRIAIASGKGGTGKTTVATNLAWVVAQAGWRVAYLDCDVEEPNGGIFLKPKFSEEQVVGKLIPQVDPALCSGCGECERICAFYAITCVGGTPRVFPELCHSCGGCAVVCPEEAIREVTRPSGRMRFGTSGPIRFVEGILDVGEHISPPVIRSVKQAAPEADLVVLDAPPGTSCPVIEAVRGSDLVVLVTEPTPFGLNDLQLAVETVAMMDLPVGVVVNRAGLGDHAVEDYCARMGITVLGEFPEDRAVAEAYSNGQLASCVVPGYQQRFSSLWNRIRHCLEQP